MINLKEELDFNGYTLIIPSTCVGNVAQLTADLIIESLKMEKVGSVFDAAIIPLIGASAYSHVTDKLTTSSELFVNRNSSVAVLQIRAPLVASLMTAFFEKLSNFIKDRNFSKLIILTSSYAHEKHNVSSNAFEYRCNEKFDATYAEDLTKLNWVKSAETVNIIHGGGYAIKLMKLASSKDIPTLILYKYVSEGDNTPDAIQLIEYLNNSINVLPVDNGKIKLSIPISWKYLFGNAPPGEIY